MSAQAKPSSPPLPKANQRWVRWQAPPAGGLAYAIAQAASDYAGPVVVVTPDTHGAYALESELSVFALGNLPILHFPSWETLPYDMFAPHPDIVSQRIEALYRLPSLQHYALVVPVSTLLQRLAPREFISGSSLLLEIGQQLNIGSERQRLDGAGYRHVPQVLEPGDYAVRGALLDIFPMGSSEPYRIELLDQNIESIRSFEPETQRSLHKVNQVNLLAAREFPLTETASKEFRNVLRERFPIDPRRCALYQDIGEGKAPAGIEYYLPLFFEQTETLFDYLHNSALFVMTSGVMEAAEKFIANTQARYEQRAHDIERPVLPPTELFLPAQQLRELLNNYVRIEIADATAGESHVLALSAAPVLAAGKGEVGIAEPLQRLLQEYPGRILLSVDSAGRREALIDQLAEKSIAPKVLANWAAFVQSDDRIAIMVSPLEQGFGLNQPPILILAEQQLSGERARQDRSRKRAAKDPDSIIRELGELAIGAPVVHEDHGVGRYQGLITLDVGGQVSEFLAITYAKGDKLYVPVGSLHLVNRYTGSSPETAPLHTLGGEQWAKAKKKAAEKVRDVAAELLDIQAKRQAKTVVGSEIDHQMYRQFAATFPFEETPDQLSAIASVLMDISANKPMDRVVCGDVGFGKTEVAVRAAFAAAQAGKQVALLVPTTLLAQQHYRNFADRFADWPIKIEVLSRFKSKKETTAALKLVADGSVDIVIGTHKLLQPDVKFKNLGLVIVDEEQRFGVRQKEQLKALRAEVDLLTLTATPIPRTLNMAMAGLRDLSIIATPPAHRVAVQTFVSQWDNAMLREAFQRELSRGGQVFFLHNEVESIERMARELEALVPEARIRVAHGQMPEKELEQVMLDFYRQRFNVLLCTTIIESGIDVPTANTIIINKADRFGLSQLHQLRGRVGRSHHRAYAYLITPSRKAMTADAAKRIDALASLDELGAGFALSTHDLEIRGAGELLGEGQSGQIQEIGFTLYTELLERAVKALKEGRIADLEDSSDSRTEVELHIPALIPDNYLPDVHHRLVLYKRVASARNTDALDALKIEMIDRFGLLPEQTKNLFAVAALRLTALKLGVKKLELGPTGGRVTFQDKPNINPSRIIQLIQTQPRVYSLDGPDKLKLKLETPGAAERLRSAQELMAAFS